jgi:ParB/RepB/Spo0J family partition protein
MSEQVVRKDLLMVPLDLIDVEPGFNIRIDMGDLEGLSVSIEAEGIKEAMRGSKYKTEAGEERFKLTDGHRRHAAGLMAVKRTGQMIKAPFMLEAKHYSKEQRVLDMFLTNDGKALTVLEKAEGVKRLINFGWKAGAIAKSIGKDESYVSRLQLLLSAPKKLINLIESGRITGTFAIGLVGKGEEKVNKFITDVDAGVYDNPSPVAPENDGGEQMFEFEKEPSERSTPTKRRITNKDVQGPNSLKELKAYLKMADPATMAPDKVKTYEFLVKLFNNEQTERSIKLFFGRSACD